MDNIGGRLRLDELFARSSAYAATAEYLRIMQFLQTFPTERPYNAYLVHMQNPEASFTATAARWAKDYEGTVRVDARPIVVLKPFGPVAFVFDIADVVGAKVPERAWRPFEARGAASPAAERLMEANAAKELVRITRVARPLTSAGSIRPLGPREVRMLEAPRMVSLFEVGDAPKAPWAAYEVEVNKAFDSATSLTTVLHELAHLLLGHLERPAHAPVAGSDVPMFRPNLREAVCELEAESVMYLVAGRLGLEDRSAEYLAKYMDEVRLTGELKRFNFDLVLKTANSLERWCLEAPRRRAAR